MSVYEKILEWSQGRPKWQQDALRRLVRSRDLSHEDVMQLVHICECEHDVSHDPVEFAPLGRGDLPVSENTMGAVTLGGLNDVRDVALLSGELAFNSQGLTVIVGRNGTGKSGYAGLLKTLCRARGNDPNVAPSIFDDSSAAPRFRLDYSVDGEPREFEWSEGTTPAEALAAVSVFDSTSVDVYLGGKTNVAYTPAGLDLLQRLADVCKSVSEELARREQQAQRTLPKLPAVQAGTSAADFLEKLSPKTTVVALEKACTFRSEQEQRKRELARKLAELEAPERKQQAKDIRLRAERLEKVAKRFDELTTQLGDDAIEKVRQSKTEAEAYGSAAEATASARFGNAPVQPVGTKLWNALFEAAAAYFEGEVSPGSHFPGNDRCVLCQQVLSPEAVERLSSFETFVTQRTEEMAIAANQRVADAAKRIGAIQAPSELVEVIVQENRDEDPDLFERVGMFCSSVEKRRNAVSVALETNKWNDLETLPDSPGDRLRQRAAALLATAQTLLAPPDDDQAEALRVELEELRACERLAEHSETIKAHWKLLTKIARYKKAIKSASTRAVSRTNGELTRDAVTEPLSKAFAREIEELRFCTIPVVYSSAGARKGEQRHCVEIAGAASVTSPAAIASSGEAQLIALAHFFTELTTAPAPSAIVLDDPTTNLDRSNLVAVANRIARAARDRQVIVFTHDEGCATALVGGARQHGVECARISLEREGNRTGLRAS